MANTRTVDFLPEIFQTTANKQFLNATLDQLVQEPTFKKTFNEKNLTKKGNFTLTSTGLKHRAKKTVTDSQRNEREKRRRRLINQQSNLYVSLEC